MLANEKDLITRSKLGDTNAFGELYDHYIRTIYDFIYYKTHHKETAEDITSQTFFKALKNIHTVDLDRSFKSWLYKIAQNTVIDYYRGKRHDESIDGGGYSGVNGDGEDGWDIPDEASDFRGDLDTAHDIGRVKKYMQKLSAAERDIIMMRVWQELSYREIAEIVGKSEASCKMMYSRSLEKLRTLVPVALFLLLVLKK